ncbi:MAG: galactose-1-phosphate uridylyltransferase [Actinomycetes bacterium]|jgi:UDPglucose--hexose-1-phosphate uridylyltransferase
MTFVKRTELQMFDGRQIFYYDRESIDRTAIDSRPFEPRPLPGDMREDILTGEWVAMAAHRQARAFLPPKEFCPLCPTKSDFGTEVADSAFEVVVFENRSPSFAAPSDQLPAETIQALGRCEVVVFSDQHEGSFGNLDLAQMRTVLAAWIDRTREISKLPYVEQIFVFENRGEEVGVTLNHPHGQIYSYPFITPRTSKMLQVAQAHFDKTNTPLLTTIIAREIKDEVRVISQNEHWIAYVPFAARYPFEIHIAPKVFVPDLAELSDAVADAFPEVAKEVLLRLDGVFGIPMAYIAGWHQAPVRTGRDVLGLHWQITSIRRAPGKLKYLAGSEAAMGAFIMDLKPEQSAQQLRDVQL